EPKNSADHNHGAYGNWPRQGSEWVEYEWSKAISTNGIAVYWWDDRRGVRLPAAAHVSYWDGTAFVPVKAAMEMGVAADHYNSFRFDEVTTTRLRLEIEGQEGQSSGIIEWKVFDSGKSPAFPPK